VEDVLAAAEGDAYGEGDNEEREKENGKITEREMGQKVKLRHPKQKKLLESLISCLRPWSLPPI
jgi:hypothetical protein